MRRLCVVLLLVMAIFATGSAFSQERFTETVGGEGGDQYQLRCPKGARLSGVTGLASAWIVRLGPVCDDGSRPGLAGGTAGRPKSASCPQGSFVSKMWVITLRNDAHLVDRLAMECVAFNDRKNITAEITFDTPEGGRDTTVADIKKAVGTVLLGPLNVLTMPRRTTVRAGTLYCGSDDIVGIQGKAGASLDSLGLICGSASTTATSSARPVKTIGKRNVIDSSSTVLAKRCTQGYVWREAFGGDTVCVLPETRDAVRADNAATSDRIDSARAPNCLTGFVWREAKPGDIVCVTPRMREQVRADNAAAASRVAN